MTALRQRNKLSPLRPGDWPSSINGDSERSDSNVGKYVRDLIRRVWGEDLLEDEEDRVVGKVRNSDITRSVTVFRVQGEEEPF